jgi:hypothetical protein
MLNTGYQNTNSIHSTKVNFRYYSSTGNTFFAFLSRCLSQHWCHEVIINNFSWLFLFYYRRILSKIRWTFRKIQTTIRSEVGLLIYGFIHQLISVINTTHHFIFEPICCRSSLYKFLLLDSNSFSCIQYSLHFKRDNNIYMHITE